METRKSSRIKDKPQISYAEVEENKEPVQKKQRKTAPKKVDYDSNNEEDEKYVQGYEPQEYKPAPITIPEIDYSKMFKEISILNNIKTYITYINTDNEIESINQKKIFLNTFLIDNWS